MKREFWDFNGLRIEYYIFEGNPTRKLLRKILGKPASLVYMHGLNDHVLNQSTKLEYIASKGVDIYAPHLPGHGDTEMKNDLGISWDYFIDLMRNFIADKNLNNSILSGYSIGGAVILKFLEKYNPDNIAEARLFMPVCFQMTLPTILRKIIGVSLYSLNINNQSNVPEPIPAHKTYILTHYNNLFTDFHLDLSRNKLPIYVQLHKKDKMVDWQVARDNLIHYRSVKLGFIKEAGHDFYYLPKKKVRQMVDELFAML